VLLYFVIRALCFVRHSSLGFRHSVHSELRKEKRVNVGRLFDALAQFGVSGALSAKIVLPSASALAAATKDRKRFALMRRRKDQRASAAKKEFAKAWPALVMPEKSPHTLAPLPACGWLRRACLFPSG